MTTTTPPGYRPDRYIVWCRWMRMYRHTFVSSKAAMPDSATNRTTTTKHNYR